MKKLLLMPLFSAMLTISRCYGESDGLPPENAFRSVVEELGPFSLSAEPAIGEKAKGLAAKYGVQMLPTLKREILARGKLSRSLALATITKLDDEQGVEDALVNAAVRADGVARAEIISAIAELPRTNAIRAAMGIIEKAPTEEVKTAVVPLFGLLGDGSTLAFLTSLRTVAGSAVFKRALADAEKNLRQRLGLSVADRQAWDDQAIPYWRMSQEVLKSRGRAVGFFLKAEVLKKRGQQFSLRFLTDQLDKGDPLAAAIIATQGNKSAQGLLKAHLAEEGAMGDVCRWALEALERSADPK